MRSRLWWLYAKFAFSSLTSRPSRPEAGEAPHGTKGEDERRRPSSTFNRLAALERENAQLRRALDSRVIIEQAKGATLTPTVITTDEHLQILEGRIVQLSSILEALTIDVQQRFKIDLADLVADFRDVRRDLES